MSTKPFLVFTEDVPKMKKKKRLWLIWLKYLLRADNSNLKTTLTQIIITVIHKSISDYKKCPIFKKVIPNVSNKVADN